MDDDSVDSETESRLVINTMDSLAKDSAVAQPFVNGLITDAEDETVNKVFCKSPAKDGKQIPHEKTSAEVNTYIYSNIVVDPVISTTKSHSLDKEEVADITNSENINDSTTCNAITSQDSSSGYQPEEGELEEGELDDDDEMVEEEESFLEEPFAQPVLLKTPPKLMDLDGNRKRNREKEDDKRRKRRRHHKEEDSSGKSRKTHYVKEEREPDFDSLLKQELYLRGEGSTPEAFKNDEEVETGESGSGEEWDKSRKRPRKKRSRSKSKSPSRKNEAICMFYLQGNCQKGNNCPYSHEMAPTRKLELCKFYMVDRCAKREKCLYMHKDFPCKYYHFGMKCVAGEDCKFSHNCLQEPAKNILCKHIESAPKDILGDFPRLAKILAMSVLTLTLDKRNGTPVMDDAVQAVIEVESKGFKYVDRCLKEYRKRNGIEKCDEKERSTKEASEEKHSKKSTKIKHKNDSKEQDKKLPKDHSKSKDRHRDRKDKDKETDKDRHRNRDRGRDRRERPERNRTRNDQNRAYKKPYPVAGSQRQRDFFQRIDNINQQQQEEDPYQHDEQHSTAGYDEQTKWYSSDEENDQVNERHELYSPNDRRKELDSNSSSEPQNNSQTPDLPDFDINYIQQLLKKVQKPISKPSDNRDSSYDNQRDYANSRNTEDFSNELKEVFQTSPEKSSASRNLTIDLQNLIKTAREKSTILDEQYSRDDYGSDPRKIYQDSRQTSVDPRNVSPFSEQPMPPVNRDPRFNRQSSVNWKSEPSLSDDSDRQMEEKLSNDGDFRPNSIVPGTRQLGERNDTGSMYDIDLRQLDAITSAEIDDINALISKMPSHTPAKEINGSINANCAPFYKLIQVSVEKPDFSNLRSIQGDPRYFEDPRLQVMFRRNSTEEQSPASPPNLKRKNSNEFTEGTLSDKVEPRESRDPRKKSSRDPRAEGKLMKAAVELRVDPRVTQRGDPRGSHCRDLVMDSYEMEQQCDRSMSGPIFINGHPLENPLSNFNNIGPMQNSFPQMDPRGRPGLLGPAPGHGVPMGMQGPMGPGMQRPPYLLATPHMAPFGREREEMMGPPGGLSQGQLWESGSSYNDPRMGRDSRQSY